MPQYVIVAEEDQDWVFDAADFAERLRARWPEAKIGIDDLDGSPMRMHALIPVASPNREMGVALADTGDGISLDPADPESAAAFVLWLIGQIPNFDVPLNISGLSEWRPLALVPQLDSQQLVEHLASF